MEKFLDFFRSVPQDLIPFMCLVTGKFPARKPMITRLIESLIVGIVGGAFSLVVGFKMLEKDVQQLKEADAQHEQWAKEHVAKRDVEIMQDRATLVSALGGVESRLRSLEDCIRVRTCTK